MLMEVNHAAASLDAPTNLAMAVRDCRRVLGSSGGNSVEFSLPDFSVAKGAQMALTGPSGCGKSTLLNLISGLLRADAGSIRIAGSEISTLPAGKLDVFRGRNIGFIYQTFNLLSDFTALENVLIGMRFGRGVSSGDRRRRAVELLKRVGLSHRMDSRPGRLSVGERQRVAIARAIANDPPIIVADEPTGSLDPQTAQDVFDLLSEVAGQESRTMLIVTHDLALAARMPERFDCLGLIRQVERS
ncbi:ABC transporter ATP-binding protein [soil metagenome]